MENSNNISKIIFQFGKNLRTKSCLAPLNTKRRIWGDGIVQEKNIIITTESSDSSSSKIHTGIKSIIASKIV